MAFAIYDGKILSAINFSAGCFNGQDAESNCEIRT
jgi:hypothetical protein